MLKAEEIRAAARAGNGGKNRCFPLRPMAREAVEEEEISCVSGEGLAFAEASFDLSNLLRFGFLGLQVQNCGAFTELRWLRY